MKPAFEELKEPVHSLKVKRLVKHAILPKKANQYAAGYDLFSSKQLILKLRSIQS